MSTAHGRLLRRALLLVAGGASIDASGPGGSVTLRRPGAKPVTLSAEVAAHLADEVRRREASGAPPPRRSRSAAARRRRGDRRAHTRALQPTRP